MKAAEYALYGHRLVILYEYHVESSLFEVVLVVCLHEVSALVVEYGRLDHMKAFDYHSICFTGRNFDLSHSFLPHIFINLRLQYFSFGIYPSHF